MNLIKRLNPDDIEEFIGQCREIGRITPFPGADPTTVYSRNGRRIFLLDNEVFEIDADTILRALNR